MLRSINIRNIALIESLSLEFGRGLNVLSGETGAGKSILIDAVNLVLGDRADRELIRRGADRAVVEAFFSTQDPRVMDVLRQAGLEPEEEVILSRELTAAGRNVARINGTLVNNAALKAVSALLIDIHGQHQHQSLFNPKAHLGLLDAYCGDRIDVPLKAYREALSRLRRIGEELQGLGGDPGERERRKDMLQFAIEEISRENITPGEEARLEQEQRVMANAERISSALTSAYESLYGVEDTPGAMELFSGAARDLVSIGDYGREYADVAEELNTLYYQAEGVVETVRELQYRFFYDPAALEAVEKRLADLQRLARKYGGSVDSALEYLSSCEEELYQLEHSEERIAALMAERAKTISAAYQAGTALSKLRHEAAAAFTQEIQVQLKDLGMGGGGFLVHFLEIPPEDAYQTDEARFGSRGLDQAEFLFSANRGEPPRPLARIASGGEASRIMLALKNIFARIDGIDCLIFDEIDTGISGAMAHVVAEKMARISRERQVLCVSHLAQLAAMADHNYLIEKREEGEKTLTHVHLLSDEERIQEIARLAGGREGDASALSHARELRQHAQEIKKRFLQ